MKNKKGCVILGCFIWLLIVIIFYAGLIFLVKAGIDLISSNQVLDTEEYIVQTDDTLWDIACKNKNEKQDIREYVYQLKKINNINDCIIKPGQTIKIIK